MSDILLLATMLIIGKQSVMCTQWQIAIAPFSVIFDIWYSFSVGYLLFVFVLVDSLPDISL